MLVSGAASGQDKLAQAAQSSAKTITQLTDVVKLGATSIGSDDPETQVSQAGLQWAFSTKYSLQCICFSVSTASQTFQTTPRAVRIPYHAIFNISLFVYNIISVSIIEKKLDKLLFQAITFHSFVPYPDWSLINLCQSVSFLQVVLINAVKDVAKALAELISATKCAAGKAADDPSMYQLKSAAKVRGSRCLQVLKPCLI